MRNLSAERVFHGCKLYAWRNLHAIHICLISDHFYSCCVFAFGYHCIFMWFVIFGSKHYNTEFSRIELLFSCSKSEKLNNQVKIDTPFFSVFFFFGDCHRLQNHEIKRAETIEILIHLQANLFPFNRKFGKRAVLCHIHRFESDYSMVTSNIVIIMKCKRFRSSFCSRRS